MLLLLLLLMEYEVVAVGVEIFEGGVSADWLIDAELDNAEGAGGGISLDLYSFAKLSSLMEPSLCLNFEKISSKTS